MITGAKGATLWNPVSFSAKFRHWTASSSSSSGSGSRPTHIVTFPVVSKVHDILEIVINFLTRFDLTGDPETKTKNKTKRPKSKSETESKPAQRIKALEGI